MKKIFILIFLGLMIVVLYAKSTKKEEQSRSLNIDIVVESDINLAEEKEEFTTYNEIKDEEIEENSSIILDLEKDMNVTRDFEVTLTVNIENLEEDDGYNCFWYEGKKFLGFGESNSLTFSKGEHNITVNVKSMDGKEANASIVVTAWEYKKEAQLFFDEKTGELVGSTIRTYNHKDNLIQIKTYNSVTLYKYNKNDLLIEEKYLNDEYKDWGYIRRYEYDNNGNRVKTERLDNNENLLFMVLKQYDDKGNIVKTEHLDSDGNMVYLSMNEYDEKGNEIHSEVLDADGNVESISISEYDENGNQIKYESLDGDGESSYLNIMEYNEKNETVSDIVVDDEGNEESYSDGTLDEEERTEIKPPVYDENGNIIVKEEYSYGSVEEKIEYIKNEEDQVLEEYHETTYLDSNLSYVVKYKYQYDDKGNTISTETETLDPNGEIDCHYIQNSTYNKDGYVVIEKNKVLKGVCYEVENAYIENIYDEDGNVIEKKTKSLIEDGENDFDDLHSTMKNENYYSNELND